MREQRTTTPFMYNILSKHCIFYFIILLSTHGIPMSIILYIIFNLFNCIAIAASSHVHLVYVINHFTTLIKFNLLEFRTLIVNSFNLIIIIYSSDETYVVGINIRFISIDFSPPPPPSLYSQSLLFVLEVHFYTSNPPRYFVSL